MYYPYELIRRQSVACVLSKNPEEKKNTSLRKYYVPEPKDYSGCSEISAYSNDAYQIYMYLNLLLGYNDKL